MSYSVIWNTNNGADHTGEFDLAAHAIELIGIDRERCEAREVVCYSDIESMFLEQTAPAKNAWEPSLVLLTHGGDRITIGSLVGLEPLYELAEHVAHRRVRVAA